MPGVKSIIDYGSGGVIITIECHLSNSLPAIVIVGVAHRSIDEAKERIRSALASCRIPLPAKRITLNLSPADLPKEGSSFDLPMLVAILSAASLIKQAPDSSTAIMGELGLDGSIKPIRGIIGKILSGKKQGIKSFWIPTGNLNQARLIPGVRLHPFSSVNDLFMCLSLGTNLPEATLSKTILHSIRDRQATSIDDIVGQSNAKRAVTIAAAGHHNILLNGPPGTGKTMLARSISSIMPDMSSEEILEVTHLHSLSSKDYEKIVADRPFRAPHHTASSASILGGGNRPLPGEVSLGHHGVVFMDELPEYPRYILESLRQPLEDKKISIARSNHTVEFPADFLLIATSNPCPCGFYGTAKPCVCLPSRIASYQKKISGPIIDRIDLYVEVDTVPHRKLLMSHNTANQTANCKKSVIKARQAQIERSGQLNSTLSGADLKAHANISPAAKALLDSAADGLKLSSRSYIRTMRVARTIADLDGSNTVWEQHVSEALQYRRRQPELTSVV